MARRTLLWHIGPGDPGTTFLAPALHAARDELADRDIAVPRGRWHDVGAAVWKHKGLSVLSTPDVARAGKDKVDLRLTGFRDVEVHLVLLVRDLPTQVYAAWQDGLRHGSTTPLGKYAARVLDPERRHWQGEEFWAGRDVEALLRRWTKAIHPERVHVVAAPSDPAGLWRAFWDVAGQEPPALAPVTTPPALTAEIDVERALDVTTRWAKLVADRGFDMRGSLVAATAGAAPAADRNDQLEALAELLTRATADVERLSAEVEGLRAENERLDRKRRKHKRRVKELEAAADS